MQFTDRPHTLAINSWRRALAAFALALLLVVQSWAAEPTPETLTILHTNDFHAHLQPTRTGKGGAAAIAAYIKSVRASVPRVLVLEAGDMTQGSPVSSVFLGRPIYEIMSAAGYDAGTLGNHEFDNGAKMIAEFCKIARYPLISSNVTLQGKPVTGRTEEVITLGGLRVGLLGLTTHEDIDLDANPALRIEEPEAAVRRLAPALKGRADLIVALTHLGDDRDLQLARATSDTLAVIVGGHSHTPMFKPARVGQTLIVQAGCFGQWVGRLDLQLDPKTHTIVKYDGKLVAMPAEGLEPDAKVAGLVKSWEDKVSGIMDVTIGQNPEALNEHQVAAALERTWSAACGTDFAWQNPGGTRGALAAGPIQVRDIWTILPFDNFLVVLTLDKAQVQKVLGARAAFKEEKPLYTLVTNSYVGRKLVGDLKLGPERVKNLDGPYRDPIIKYVREHGGFAEK